ncbi:MAG TPA: hypothetical protein GX522_07390 [Firmicutes bacterium]|jgi:NADH:ubiquinone oxidoreductase subunit 6 (subunit J)|nr:hypothetical protein [Bacillota bacterium]
MHWIFYLVALMNIATGALYIKRRNKKYALLSFIVAGVVLVLGYILKV